MILCYIILSYIILFYIILYYMHVYIYTLYMYVCMYIYLMICNLWDMPYMQLIVSIPDC